MTIDMQKFMGETDDSAAVGQNSSSNSYSKETQSDDVVVDQSILEQVSTLSASEDQSIQPEIVKEPSQQELNFKALREEVDRIKSEKEELRQNLDILRANVNQKQVKAEEPKKFLEGLNDNDVPNVAEIRRAFEQRESEYQSRLEELQVQQANPDYNEVMDKYLTPLLKQKPHLAEGIMGARNKALFAYELGKMAKGHQETPQIQSQPSANAQKIVENAKKPGSIAQVGGQSILSKADYYATMSDQDFMAMASKNLGEI